MHVSAYLPFGGNRVSPASASRSASSPFRMITLASSGDSGSGDHLCSPSEASKSVCSPARVRMPLRITAFDSDAEISEPRRSNARPSIANLLKSIRPLICGESVAPATRAWRFAVPPCKTTGSECIGCAAPEINYWQKVVQIMRKPSSRRALVERAGQIDTRMRHCKIRLPESDCSCRAGVAPV